MCIRCDNLASEQIALLFMSVILMLIEQVFLGDLVVKCPWALHYRSE